MKNLRIAPPLVRQIRLQCRPTCKALPMHKTGQGILKVACNAPSGQNLMQLVRWNPRLNSTFIALFAIPGSAAVAQDRGAIRGMITDPTGGRRARGLGDVKNVNTGMTQTVNELR